MTPLFRAKGYELQALTGEISHFYEVIPPDLEGASDADYEKVMGDLENDLIQTESVFKLYSLGGRLFLNAFGDVTLTHGSLCPSERPIETFLGRDEANIHFYENYLTQGNEYIRLLSMKDFPERMMPFESSTLGDFVLCCKKVPKAVAKNRINLKRKLHFSALFKGMRDLDAENAFNQAESILDQVTTDGAGLFVVECYLILRAPTKKELDQLTDYALALYKAKDAALRIEERGLSFLYQSLIPGVPASFKRSVDIPSDYFSYWVPFHRDFIHEQGLGLFSRADNPIWVDIFHPTALSFNALITGTSGQGKSMFANRLLEHQLGLGAKVIVLDLGNSFRKSALFHGGAVFSEKFNPMQFKCPRYLKEFVLSAIDEKLGKKSEGKIFEEIKIVLAEKPDASFDELISGLGKEFGDIGFYFSEIKEFFSEESQELKDFTYCDFGLYPEAMKAPLIIYLIECFKNLKGRKIFVFDECWHLLDKNAAYIAECFRTFRKHNASAVAISQNLDDFSQTQLGRVIIQTSFNKFLFRQALQESEFIDTQSKAILDSVQSHKGQYSEFLYLSEVCKKPLRYKPSPLEYEVFTTDPMDAVPFQKYMEEQGHFLSFKKAIENYTKIKHALGGVA
jgi:hypothetical protein